MTKTSVKRGATALVIGYAGQAHALLAAPTAVPVFDAWGLVGLSVAVAAAAFFVKKRKK